MKKNYSKLMLYYLKKKIIKFSGAKVYSICRVHSSEQLCPTPS